MVKPMLTSLSLILTVSDLISVSLPLTIRSFSTVKSELIPTAPVPAVKVIASVSSPNLQYH